MASVDRSFVICLSLIFLFSDCSCTAPYEEIVSFKEEYVLPALPYEYNALEPFIDEATMRVHHTGHHASYTKKLNAALKAWRKSVSGTKITQRNPTDRIDRRWPTEG